LKNILGIGSAGCNIVGQLSKNKVYTPYFIGNEFTKTTKNKFQLSVEESPDKYEALDLTKLTRWLNKINKNCTVFLCGASDSTGITLRVLESLHRRGTQIEVVYFIPETEVLSEAKMLHERACRGILQNYARSGLFEKITLVSNLYLEKLAGPTNVFDYYEQINEAFVGAYYMIDVFKNTKPASSTFKKPKETCRIATLALASLTAEDKMLSPFSQEIEVVYYYGIDEKRLRSEENLFRTITDKVKSRITAERKVSFGIYPTQYEADYIYAEYFSPKIQEIPVDTE
jgi:hypothetical protein